MSSQELLGRLKNMSGLLGSDLRGRLRSVLLRPSAATWDDAKDLAITSWGLTLKTVVFRLYPVNAFFTKDEAEQAVPDSFTIRQALDWAVHAEERHAREAGARRSPNPV